VPAIGCPSAVARPTRAAPTLAAGAQQGPRSRAGAAGGQTPGLRLGGGRRRQQAFSPERLLEVFAAVAAGDMVFPSDPLQA
jgi:hypothetical protein